MHAQNLLEYLEELSPEAAEGWVAAALAEAAALRAHDDRLYPEEGDPAAMSTAERLHEVWRDWADDADGLLARVGSIRAAGRPVGRVDELEYAVGRARAMLKVSPQSVIEARQQVRRGEVYTAEEVRRELGLEHRR